MLLGSAAAAQQLPGPGSQDPPRTTPAPPQSPWNTGTQPRDSARPPAAAPAEPGGSQGNAEALTLRVYGNDDRWGQLPYRPRREDRAYALDVTAIMTRCPDGNLAIRALVIGGLETPLENPCPDGSPGTSTPPECDAQRWNCGSRTGPADEPAPPASLP
ncbi:MAG: hypothetical protein KJ041_00625 [Gammaproteobacteria bacterium]|nr:hypothetical protein [Gammaproteobacteria bacterium]